MFCFQPFNRIEIYENGDVFNCCPPFINNYSIGNIFKTPFDEIWNGEKVKTLRNKILQGDFSLCNDICNYKYHQAENSKNYTDTVIDYPEEISISTDTACNVRCKICRDVHYKTDYNKEKLEEEIDNIWLPIFKNCRLLRFGCSGEPFASYKEKMLIKKAAQKYPDIKFHFHTNGILANENVLKDLNVFDKINTITVSLHSASRWTYNKIVRGGKWDKVQKNLKLYSDMKKNNIIQEFRMIFVIYSENYKEMEKFAKMAQKYNAIAEFWALRPNESTEMGKNYFKYAVTQPNHKDYKKLKKILSKPIFNSPNVILYPEIVKIRESEN